MILSNFISTLNRASKQKQLSTLSPYNNLVLSILSYLTNLGYIRGFTVLNRYRLRIYLKFDSSGFSAIRGIMQVSRPGNRVYVSLKPLSQLNKTFSTGFISTCRGLKTFSEAEQLNLGGEYLLKLL